MVKQNMENTSNAVTDILGYVCATTSEFATKLAKLIAKLPEPQQVAVLQSVMVTFNGLCGTVMAISSMYK